jgi:tripartite-type tricarboxylate transporter receptor subunit TctC
MQRRDLLQYIARGIALAALPTWSMAQSSWPTKPQRLIVPFPAGGTTDLLGRHLGNALSQSLGQPVIVDNKPGAGTVIGVDAAAKSAADGNTWVCVANSFCVNHSLVKNLPYDSLRDLRAVGLLAVADHVLATHPQSGIRNLSDLLAQAKKNPGKLSYASFGNGTSSHLAGAMLANLAGIDLIHVPYKGQAPAMNDLMGGQVTMMFGNWPEFRPQIQAGKLVGVGMATLQRSPQAPDLPTLAEQGVAMESNSWFGLMVRNGTPAAVVQRLNLEVNKALQTPDLLQVLQEGGMRSLANTPENFEKFLRAEIDKYARVIQQAHITLDGA